MPALACIWPLPSPSSPLNQVQPQELFPLVTDSAQQRGCPRDQGFVVPPGPHEPMSISLHSPGQWAWPVLTRPRPIMNKPLGANQVPQCRQPAGTAAAAVGPSGPTSALRKRRSLVHLRVRVQGFKL